MSATHPISFLLFSHDSDKPVIHSSNYTGYIPRRGERISVNGGIFEVNTVIYMYDSSEHKLDEVHIITQQRR